MKIDTLQAVVAELLRKEEKLRCTPGVPDDGTLFMNLSITTLPGKAYQLQVQSRNGAMHQEVAATLSRFAVDVEREVVGIPCCVRAT